MFHKHLLVAGRALRKQPVYALLNVLGLGLGLASCVLIGLYLLDEFSFDRFHPSADRIVRMSMDFLVADEVRPNVATQGLLGPALQDDVPEVEATVRILGGPRIVEVNGQRYEEQAVILADSTLFTVFDGFTLLKGDPKSVLDAPDKLVLSASTARRYFGDADPIGQIVREGDRVFQVSGIMADLPTNSSLQFDGVSGLEGASDPGWWYENWLSVNFLTFVKLRSADDLDGFRAQLPVFLERRAGGEMAESGRGMVLYAERLQDIHLWSDRGDRGSPANLLALATVALLILLVACINYTNLATARSVERAREVGVRKTLGATRGELAVQFLTEAVLLSLLGAVVAGALVWMAQPLYEHLTGKTYALLAQQPLWALACLGLAALTGLLAGAYPALVLSGHQAATVLRGRFATGRQGFVLRKGLVALQFGIAVALIAGTVLIGRQIDFMLDRDLGFDAGGDGTQLLVVNLGSETEVPVGLDVLKQRLDAYPAVMGVTSSLTVPVGGHPVAGGELERPDGVARDFDVEAYLVDSAFVDVYGLEIIAGRRPGGATTSDSLGGYVLNETAVRQAGYTNPTDILGRQASFWGYDGEVVGVVRDFHTRGLQVSIEPLAMVVVPDYQSVVTLRVRTDDLPQTLRDLDALWRDLVPGRPFAYSFLDDTFGEQYEAERRFGRVFGLFAGVAILTACLGLFGLAAFTAQQRTKEIGIRKVLGASVESLMVLLTREVVALVAVGFVVAVPLAYMAMDRWLDAFAYRTTIHWGVFLLAGLLALTLAVLTVASHAFRAASADPVKALRYE